MKNLTFVLMLLVFINYISSAENVEIRGKITDYNNKPITGIEINFFNVSSNSAITDRYGDYKLTLDDTKSYDVQFRFYGYINSNKIEISNINSNKYDFQLSLDSLEMLLRGHFDNIEYEETTALSVDHVRAIDVSDSEIRTLSAKVKPLAAGAESSEAIDKDLGGSGFVTNSNVSAGLLTSGEVNDFRKWDMWNDLTDQEFEDHSKKWKFEPRKRYTVQLVNINNTPVIDAEVAMKNQSGSIIWIGRTDNTGKAELWADIFTERKNVSFDEYDFEIISEESKIKYPKALPFLDNINVVNLIDECNKLKNLDILFAVDATGSMGDEINYLKAELNDIISRVKENNQELNINLGSVFYRDDNDEYLVQMSEFSTDFEKTSEFIKLQNAAGGGDFPEAVDAALFFGINKFNWSNKAVARIMFLILDAPPHDDETTIERIHELTARAAIDGIRVVPVACSGVDKSSEFVLRSIALATNGTYVFLTDDSGIGGSHIKPSTDKYEVEKLNDLFIRLIEQFTTTPTCDNDNYSNYAFDDRIFNEGEVVTGVSSEAINCYPNPTSGIFNVELNEDVDELYLVDVAGKIIRKLPYTKSGSYEINISEFPTGVYYVKYLLNGKWGAFGILLNR